MTDWLIRPRLLATTAHVFKLGHAMSICALAANGTDLVPATTHDRHCLVCRMHLRIHTQKDR